MKKTYGLFAVILALLLALSCCLVACDDGKQNETKTLQSIEVTTKPTKLTYEEGEMLDLSGMVVTATFNTGKEDVTKDCTVALENRKLATTDKIFYVAYKYDGVLKTATVNITVTGEVLEDPILTNYSAAQVAAGDASFSFPYDIVTTSDADYVFFTYYHVSGMNVDGALELVEGETAGSGSFRYTEVLDNNPTDGVQKTGRLEGTYKIKGTVLTMYTQRIYTTLGTQKFSKQGNKKQMADVVLDKNNNIVAIDCGSIATEGLFGYTKNKDKCEESLGTTHGETAADIWMDRIFNKTFPAGMTTYWSVPAKTAQQLQLADDSTQRTSYYVGQRLEADSELKLVVTYSENETETITSGYTRSPEIITADTKEITVTYNGVSCTYPVEVTVAAKGELVRIDVENAPTEVYLSPTTLTMGQAVAAAWDKMIVTGIYSDGKGGVYERNLSDYIVEKISEDDIAEVGYNKAYTVSSGNRYFTVTGVTVAKASPIDTAENGGKAKAFFTYFSYSNSASSTENMVYANAALLLYDDGTFIFDFRNGESKGSYNYGTWATDPSDASYIVLTRTSRSVSGSDTLKGNLPTTQKAQLIRNANNEIVAVDLGSMIRNSGNLFGFDKPAACFTNDVAVSLAEKYLDVATNAELKAHCYMVAVSSLDISDTDLQANIYYKPVVKNELTKVSELTLNTDNVIKTYYTNATFSADGIVISAVTASGTIKINPKACEISSPDMTTAGTKMITVSYNGVSATFEITVEKPAMQRIEADASAISSYKVGETFSANGLKVTAYYVDGTSEVLSEGFNVAEHVFTDAEGEAGKATLTVTCGTLSAEFTVNVTSPETVLQSISLNTDNVAQSFKYGETFSYEGLIVTANYSTGESKAASGFSVSKPTMTTLGKQTVTVTYVEGTSTKTATYEIVVTNYVARISVENAPSQIAVAPQKITDVAAFIKANLSSLKVSKVFADGTVEDTEDFQITPDGEWATDGKLNVGNGHAFTVSVADGTETKTAKVENITLSYYAPVDIAKKSQADVAFWTQFICFASPSKPQIMKVNAAMELNYNENTTTSGTFNLFYQSGDDKGTLLSGTWITDSADSTKLTLTVTSKFVYLGKDALSNANVETTQMATTVTNTDGKLIALNFGTMVKDSGSFFGFSKTEKCFTKDGTANIANNYLESSKHIAYFVNVTELDWTQTDEKMGVYYPSVILA